MKFPNRPSHAAVVLILSVGLTVACTDRLAPQPKLTAQPVSGAIGVAEDSQVGVVPAGPGKEAPATTSAVKSDMSKAEQSSAMPMPGQANDHSTLKPTPSKRPASSAH